MTITLLLLRRRSKNTGKPAYKSEQRTRRARGWTRGDAAAGGRRGSDQQKAFKKGIKKEEPRRLWPTHSDGTSPPLTPPTLPRPEQSSLSPGEQLTAANVVWFHSLQRRRGLSGATEPQQIPQPYTHTHTRAHTVLQLLLNTPESDWPDGMERRKQPLVKGASWVSS